MEYRFEVTEDGQVRVVLSENAPVLAHALEDCIGSRPPRGASQDGLSTYWVDGALRDVKARLADSSDEVFASGNVSYMQVRDGKVEARYDYDPPDGDDFGVIDVETFIHLVEDWRSRILEVSPGADKRRPQPRAARPMPGR